MAEMKHEHVESIRIRFRDTRTAHNKRSARRTKASREAAIIRRIVIIVVVIVAAIVVWKVFFATPKLPASIVALSGRVEGDDSAVAPKTSGKILEVTVREGDTVTVGQVIARLDDAQVRAKEDGARAALADAEAKSRAASDQIATLQEQLVQNKQQTEQSKTDAAGRVRQAQADLTAAEATLTQQLAAQKLADFNRDAYAQLAKTGAASAATRSAIRSRKRSNKPQ